MDKAPSILYCHCRYANVLPFAVKEAVLRHLCDGATAFDAVADLCELAARKDPLLSRLAGGGPLKIAACHPRAVKGLFAAAGAPLPPGQVQVLNMRSQMAPDIIAGLNDSRLTPNLPADKAPRPAETAEDTKEAP